MPFTKGHTINLGRKQTPEAIEHSRVARKKLLESGAISYKGEKNCFYGKKHTLESKEKMRIAKLGKDPWNKNKSGYKVKDTTKMKGRTGDKCPRYKKDRSLLVKKQIRNDSAYRDWRLQVYRRDNFKCRINNQDCEGRIIAHHILGWTKYPELRYELNNGITLCEHHHPLKREKETELVPYFKNILQEVKI